jgi:NAD-dependent deacetylase
MIISFLHRIWDIIIALKSAFFFNICKKYKSLFLEERCMETLNTIKVAARHLSKSKKATVFTGAGISVESGIPPFRGQGGLWNKYDPEILELEYFLKHPEESWKVIREIFYDFFGKSTPNEAHFCIARLEKMGHVQAVITQNIDNLHQEAGSTKVYEFHGNSSYLICIKCQKRFHKNEINIKQDIPSCILCGGLLKPDFIFFGEAIPEYAAQKSYALAENSDIFLIIGSTGEVMPACHIPYQAKSRGSMIIEINPEESNFSRSITDIHIQMKAGRAMSLLVQEIESLNKI